MSRPTCCNRPMPSVRVSAQADLDDGWGIEVTKPTVSLRQSKKVQGAVVKQEPQAPQKKKQAKKSPFMDISSEQGLLGLTLLKAKLQKAEQGQGALTSADKDELFNSIPRIAKTAAEKQAKRLGKGEGGPAAATKRKVIVYEDDDGNTWEGPAEENTPDELSFEINVEDENLEYVEYDKQGRVVSRTVAEGSNNDSDDPEEIEDEDEVEEEEDEFDFSGSGDKGWGALPGGSKNALAIEDIRGARKTREIEAMVGTEDGEEANALVDDDELQEWGLDELPSAPLPPSVKGAKVKSLAKGSQRSLMQELGVAKGGKARGVDEDLGVTVTWGGNAGTFSTDLDEQERLLARMFKPHKAAKMMEHQKAALKELEALRRGSATKRKTDAATHRQLRVVAGSAADVRLLSSQGQQTRPMMEKVRQAIFNMIQSQAGTVNCLPTGSRWLDLFAGTGSVGLEALSRGCRECHFIEMDPWVTRNILGKNIASCGFNSKAICHTMKAEEFLQKAVDVPRFAGGAFDFISMCPPYLLVSYPQLFELMSKSHLLHEHSIFFVEYPKQLAHEVPETINGLVQVRNRKYGRTWIVVYGPPSLTSREYAEEFGDEDD